VGIDERGGGHAIGQHLASLGHRRIGFIKGPPEHRAATLRFDGFLEALREAGIEDQPWTGNGDFTFKSGVEAAEQLLRNPMRITALACANDDMAAGAMLALHRAGLEIPTAISVTGFDDTPMSEVVWPPLTTVRQPIQDFTERAVQLLVENPSAEGVRFDVLPFALVVRESTAPPSRSWDA
jgi:LacI family transcriptional regulator